MEESCSYGGRLESVRGDPLDGCMIGDLDELEVASEFSAARGMRT